MKIQRESSAVHPVMQMCEEAGKIYCAGMHSVIIIQQDFYAFDTFHK